MYHINRWDGEMKMVVDIHSFEYTQLKEVTSYIS